MASTFSTSLRLELMATGDQSGTWGDTTNTNLGTLLEQAITGVLSVAQGDVANLTLTSLDGASDQARNAVINVTGALTAARNVVVPTANKLYLAKNSTTGGYAVTFKTSAGTGVSVAAGTAQWVYCDGTNVVQGLTGTLATQAASGVAITGGTITGLTSLTLASGAVTPATNDAAALGTSSRMWSDLFLASGGVINWNNGNYTLTHSAGLLTASGSFSIGTSNAMTVGTIELGAATDTTLSRSAAGVLAVEGVDVPTISSTSTLTNKRVTPRIGTVTGTSTITPAADSSDQYNVTALWVNATFAAPSGTPTNGQRLTIRIKDDGSSHTLNWNAIYRAVGVTLPTATTANKTLYVDLVYNSADTKWDCVYVAKET